jgi:hypothetical protein
MSQDQQVRALMNAALSSKSPQLANDIILQMFGQSGLTALLYARRSGKSFDSMRGDASKRIFATDSDRSGALGGMAAFRNVGDEFKGIFEGMGAKTLSDLAPALREFTGWLSSHQSEISQMISGMAALTAGLLDFVGSPAISAFVIMSDVWAGKWDKARADINKYGEHMAKLLPSDVFDWAMERGMEGAGISVRVVDRTAGGIKAALEYGSELHSALDQVGQSKG